MPNRLWRGLSKPFYRLPHSFGAAAGLVTSRFPVAAVLVCVFALVSNFEVANWNLWPDWPRLLSALAGAAAASVAMRVGAEARVPPGSPWLVVLPALAALVIGVILWFGEPLILYAPALLPALLFAIPLAPFAGRGTERQFWTFTLWAGVGVTLAFISVLVFAAGLSTILEMIRFLFHVGPGNRAYEHIFVTALTLVGPLFALGRIPPVSKEELVFSREDRLVAAVRPLFDWVAAPLVLATSVVLHLYALRIVVTGEVPVGEIGWIVTFFTILVLGLRIAIDPFLEMGARPARIFGRIWAPLLVVPLVLLAVAAALRIGEHGFTIDRYFLVLGGIAGTIALLVQLVPWLRGDIRVLAAIPTLLLALSVAGPWSAAEVVAQSQVSRIAAEFAGASGRLEPMVLERDRRWALRSRLVELEDVGRLEDLAPLVPEDRMDALAALDGSSDALLAVLGITAEARSVARAGPLTAIWLPELDIDGFDRAGLNLSAMRGVGETVSQEIALALDGSWLLIDWNGVRDRVDLTAPIAAMVAEGAELIADPDLDLMTEAGRHLRLRFASVTLDDQALPQDAVVTILWRRAEWTPSFGGG